MIELKGDLWWPQDDYHCRTAMQAEVHFVHDIMKIVPLPHKNIIQAGGNVGIYPIEYSRYFEKVYTFEPDPENYECLVRNTSGYNKIVPHNCGLGDVEESVGLGREAQNCGAHYVAGQGNIQIKRIDDFYIMDVGLIHLDIEGYEHKALRGALETIKRDLPVIVCEEKGLGSRYEAQATTISGMLYELGYNIYGKIGNDVIYLNERRK